MVKQKKKSGNPFLVILLIVVVAAAIAFGLSRHWRTGDEAVADLRSLFEQGKANLNGGGTPYERAVKADSDETAIPLFEKAAAQGDARAMLALGDIYNKSKTETDGDKAVAWYKKASDAGNVEAKRKLAAAIGMGRGSREPDIAEADKLMGEAAAAGDGKAQLIYGRNLAGAGQAKVAEPWLLKAAAQNVPGTSAALGNLYYDWRSDVKDYEKARQWYAKAAVEGDTQSQLNYSYMYYSGRGVEKDDAEAWKWLAIADGDQDKVKIARGFLKDKISADAVAEGDKRAAAWRASHPAAR